MLLRPLLHVRKEACGQRVLSARVLPTGGAASPSWTQLCSAFPRGSRCFEVLLSGFSGEDSGPGAWPVLPGGYCLAPREVSWRSGLDASPEALSSHHVSFPASPSGSPTVISCPCPFPAPRSRPPASFHSHL